MSGGDLWGLLDPTLFLNTASAPSGSQNFSTVTVETTLWEDHTTTVDGPGHATKRCLINHHPASRPESMGSTRPNYIRSGQIRVRKTRDGLLTY